MDAPARTSSTGGAQERAASAAAGLPQNETSFGSMSRNTPERNDAGRRSSFPLTKPEENHAPHPGG